jgi:hypothetical protein
MATMLLPPQSSKVEGTANVTHIHILELGKDAKIPLWGQDLWVLNPQSLQRNIFL